MYIPQARWEEWCQHYFGVAWVSPYGDDDHDGLCNILEYYADVDVDVEQATDWEDSIASLPIGQIGCDHDQK